MARVEPLRPNEWPKTMRPALEAMIPSERAIERPVHEGRPQALNTLGTFAHHPALAKAYFTFNGHIMMNTTLSLRHREMVVLRVGTVLGCVYEWAQHVVVGHDAGLTDLDIARITFGPTAPFWSPFEAALLRSVDEIVKAGAIGEATWAALREEYNVQQILDLIFTVGSYQILASMMGSFDLELDDDLVAYLTPQTSSGE